MTRINNHQVIQMVGNDRIVFVDDSREIVKAIADAQDLFDQWEDQDAGGNPLTISDGSWPMVLDSPYAVLREAVSYFVDCAAGKYDDEPIRVLSKEPDESIEDFFERAFGGLNGRHL